MGSKQMDIDKIKNGGGPILRLRRCAGNSKSRAQQSSSTRTRSGNNVPNNGNDSKSPSPSKDGAKAKTRSGKKKLDKEPEAMKDVVAPSTSKDQPKTSGSGTEQVDGIKEKENVIVNDTISAVAENIALTDQNVAFHTAVVSQITTQFQPKAPTTSNGRGSMAEFRWSACILWNTKILEKMEINQNSNYEAYTYRGMGKMLTKNTSNLWVEMDWEHSHILLDVFEKKMVCDDDGMYTIKVAEKTWFKNQAMPVNNRLWKLCLPSDMKELAYEMIRNPNVNTTVMVWSHKMRPYETPLRESDTLVCGKILVKLSQEERPAILIFHHEDITRLRRSHIQNQLRTSELKSFSPQRFVYITFYAEESNSLEVRIFPRDEDEDKRAVEIPSWIRNHLHEGERGRNTDNSGSLEGDLANRSSARTRAGMAPPRPPPPVAAPGSSRRLHRITEEGSDNDASISKRPRAQQVSASQGAFLHSQELSVSHEQETSGTQENSERVQTPVTSPGESQRSDTYRFTQYLNEL